MRVKAQAAVDSAASEKGYNMVLNSQGVVSGGKSLDITGDVLAKLDADVSEIKLDPGK